MRKRIVTILLTIALLFGIPASAYADTDSLNPYGRMIDVEVTAYCLNGLTAMETQTRPGICAAKREWLGKTAILYTVTDGIPELYGIYEIQDTGDDYRIKAGKVIDIWLPTYDECKQFGRQKMKVQIIDAEG